MSNLQISERFKDFEKDFKIINSSIVSFIKSNGIESYECSLYEPQVGDEYSKKKLYFVKKVKPAPEVANNFEAFLNKFIDFQNNTLTPSLLRLHSVYKNNGFFYLVQRDYQSNLSKKSESFSEIEIWRILRDIVKFYSHIKDDDSLYNALLEDEFPLKSLSQDVIYYYRKAHRSGSEKIPVFKVKVDLLWFGKQSQMKKTKNDPENFHMEEFDTIVKSLLNKKKIKLGPCSNNLLRILNAKSLWKDLFEHPIFRVDRDLEVNYKMWQIKEEDRNLTTTKQSLARSELEKTNPIHHKPNNKPNLLNEEYKSNFNMGEENMNLDENQGITSKIQKINSETDPPFSSKKNQIHPEMRLEDENEQNILLKNNKKEDKSDKECHCSCY